MLTLTIVNEIIIHMFPINESEVRTRRTRKNVAGIYGEAMEVMIPKESRKAIMKRTAK